jgi:hypothetical protein
MQACHGGGRRVVPVTRSAAPYSIGLLSVTLAQPSLGPTGLSWVPLAQWLCRADG